MNKRALIVAVIFVFVIIIIPSTFALESLPPPTVKLPTSWAEEASIPYPESPKARYDPAGAGQLQFVEQNENAFVIINYESVGDKIYSKNDLVDEAISIFEFYWNYSMTDYGIISVAGTSAGYAKTYENDMYVLQVVLVKNDYYMNIPCMYSATAETESQVMSLIDSIDVGSNGLSTSFIAIGAATAISVLAVFLIFRILRQRKTAQGFSIGAFPVGWQFYEGLTGGDPPGTVYRFTKKYGKQRVEIIKAPEYPIELDVCDEEVGKLAHTATMNTFIQFTGLKMHLLGKIKEADELKLEMPGLMREATRDVNLDPLIEQLINKKEFRFREDEKYYVIRAARKTMEINYQLNQRSIDDLGGEAGLVEEELKAKNLTYVKQKQSIKQRFDSYRRVMFNAEEIKIKRDKDGRISIVH